MERKPSVITRIFPNRTEAGRALGGLLRQCNHSSDALVLGLPRGGIPVAYEVARALNAEMDALLVRKISIASYPELAIGAVADGGVVYVNHELLRELGISERAFHERLAIENAELLRRQRVFRGDRQPPAINGRLVFVVDDGIATGASMKVALQSVRALNPAEVVCAVPVAPTDFEQRLAGCADRFFCVLSVSDFRAVGQFYENFDQVSESEVCRLLTKARETRMQPI